MRWSRARVEDRHGAEYLEAVANARARRTYSAAIASIPPDEADRHAPAAAPIARQPKTIRACTER
jgi:hypothetical protein